VCDADMGQGQSSEWPGQWQARTRDDDMTLAVDRFSPSPLRHHCCGCYSTAYCCLCKHFWCAANEANIWVPPWVSLFGVLNFADFVVQSTVSHSRGLSPSCSKRYCTIKFPLLRREKRESGGGGRGLTRERGQLGDRFGQAGLGSARSGRAGLRSALLLAKIKIGRTDEHN
jgi:hypothetical protein